MRFCTLSSGSSGNSVLLSHNNTNILIDCGRSGKHIAACLNNAGISPNEIDAVLVTHEHTDHISGIGVMSRMGDIPIMATEGTWQGIEAYGRVGKIDKLNIRRVTPYEVTQIGDIKMLPFDIPHDANQPVGYRFQAGNTVIAAATDIGCLNESVVRGVAGADVVLLESNHDVDMVRESAYPQHLKNRILSSRGHLSNENAAVFAAYLAGHGTQHIILGHLSEENNIPEIAYNTTASAMRKSGVSCNLIVAERHTNSEIIET